MVMNSNFYERFFGEKSNVDIDEDGRMNNKMLYLKHMIEYPWGGDKLRASINYRSAHDLCLDAYNEAGIFALLALIIMLYNSVKNLLLTIKNKERNYSVRLLVLCIYLATYVEFFMEPILRGIPWLLVAFLVLEGAVKAGLDKVEQQ